MRAIRVHEFGPPEVMKLEVVPDPVPGPGQVVVAIKAIGVNPVDTYIRAGIYGARVFPYTPGLDGAGVIESVGEGAASFEIGDRVYVAGSISGTYAEKVVCGVSQVHPLPESLSFEQGAGLGVPYATAYTAIHRCARAVAGEAALVHGASGGVGTAAVQIACAAGLRVFGTASTEEGRELVLRQGAHAVLDHGKPGYLQKGLELTGGTGFDVILEMLANLNLGRDLKVLAQDGRVIVIGSRGTVEIDPRDTMGRGASIIGMSLARATEKELASAHAGIRAGLANGTLCPVVGRQIPLAEAALAHHEVIESRACGKIVLLA